MASPAVNAAVRFTIEGRNIVAKELGAIQKDAQGAAKSVSDVDKAITGAGAATEKTNRSVKQTSDNLARVSQTAPRAARDIRALGDNRAILALLQKEMVKTRRALGHIASHTKQTAGQYRAMGAAAQQAGTQAKTASDKASAAASKQSALVGKLRVAYGAYGKIAAAALTAYGFIRAVDQITALDNRLRILTGNSAGVRTLRAELFDLSRETRQAYGGSAELYARVGLAAKQLGADQKELLTFTELTNKAIAIGGTNATESAAALIQLSQGLASNTLRGDELRSVLEQMPALADAIAAGLGVTRGELRALGAEGKLTARAVLDAILSQQDSINAQFASFEQNVSQGWQVLTTGASELAKGIDDMLGLCKLLANSFVVVGNAMGYIADGINSIIDTDQKKLGELADTLERINQARAGGDENGAIAQVRQLSDEDLNEAEQRATSQVQTRPSGISGSGNHLYITSSQANRRAKQEAEQLLDVIKQVRAERKAAAQESAAIAVADTEYTVATGLTPDQAAAARELQTQLEADRIALIENSHERARQLAINAQRQQAQAIRENIADSAARDSALAKSAENLQLRLAQINKQEADEKTEAAARAAAAQQRINKQTEQQRQRNAEQRRRMSDALHAHEIRVMEDGAQKQIAASFLQAKQEAQNAANLTSDIEEQLRLREAAWQRHQQRVQQINDQTRADALQHAQDTAVPVPAYHQDPNYQRDTDLQLAGQRAALTPDGADDLAVRRDTDLAAVDDSEAAGNLSPEHAAEQRALILEEYTQALADLDETAATLGDSIGDHLFGQLGEHSKKATESMKGAFEALQKGDAGKSIAGLAKGFGQLGAEALLSGQSVEDSLKQMVQATLGRQAVAIAEYFAVQAIDLAATAFSLGAIPPGTILQAYYGDKNASLGFGGSSDSKSGDSKGGGGFSIFHDGGIVGADAPPRRYHSGGIAGARLAADEVPAILQRGEGVFTAAQMRALAPASAITAPQSIQINIVNESGEILEADESRTTTQQTDTKTIITMVVNNINSGGRIAQAIDRRNR